MPTSKLEVDWRKFRQESSRLQSLIPSLGPIPPAHRKLIAEIVMVRLFLLVENTVASIGTKILCGAPYLDGTQPRRLIKARSMSAATAAMKTLGRAKPKAYLFWTRSRGIRDNLTNTLEVDDPFFSSTTNHASLLTDMRYVRN